MISQRHWISPPSRPYKVGSLFWVKHDIYGDQFAIFIEMTELGQVAVNNAPLYAKFYFVDMCDYMICSNEFVNDNCILLADP